ncbi:MAG: response regulator [Amaricoccus sp.]
MAGPKVLVVEDEALIRFTIADDLRDAGFEVVEAATADQAIGVLSDDPGIRLLFTDIDMPGSMDGLRLSAVLRDRWPPVRILVTSGKQVPATAEMPAGSRFMPKPYAAADVLDAVRAMLA